MPLVNRLLDAFFRTLDAVDVARERLDRALGRAPRPEPWTSEWSPTPSTELRGPSHVGAPPPAREESVVVAQAPKEKAAAAKAPRAAKTTTKKPAPKAAKNDSTVPRPAPGKAPKKAGDNRKGSVDRSGKDFDSPRAKAIVEALKASGTGVIAEDAALDGKRVLARVLWALLASDQAGSELGLTAADASALLHLAAGVEVFATNVARTCRDHNELIEESEPDGRSKRYKLTAAGRAAAAKLPTRPM
jgi:hypothetical protein